MRRSTFFLVKFCLGGMLLALAVWQPYRAQEDTQAAEADYIIETVAGSGEEGFSGDGGPAVQAQLQAPRSVAVDRDGNFYIADTSNHRIRRVDSKTGTIATVAGIGEYGFGGDDGPAVQAKLWAPRSVAVDGRGNLLIADTSNYRIRRVDARTRIITTVAGIGEYGFSGDGGPAVAAQLNSPYGVAADSDGNFYIADTSNRRIRMVDTAGNITTVAGTGESGFGGDGGPAVHAQLFSPYGVAVDGAYNLYIATGNRIRRVDTAGNIATLAGIGRRGFSGDGGPAVQARLYFPSDVAVNDDGSLYIADTFNHRIRRVDTLGIITTIAGTGARGFSGDGGPAVRARLNWPRGVAVNGDGNVYIVERDNHRIRRVSPPLPVTLQAPTKLTATPVSTTRIDLAWQDNGADETGFRVQRRLEGSSDWVLIETTPANVTSFSDVGLVPGSLYHYRVQAFSAHFSLSAFSNQVQVSNNLEVQPPTLTRFSPTSEDRPGTRVMLAAEPIFVRASAVRFNRVDASLSSRSVSEEGVSRLLFRRKPPAAPSAW